ncbi:MAG: hypothetical protein K6C12_08760 [Oscillospiraceae bacterium]|nr:hypothetical protein [Oscillospiraceae bacterium]
MMPIMNSPMEATLEATTHTVRKGAANMEESLKPDGWKKISMGCSYSIKYDNRFDLYTRRRNLKHIMESNSKDFENLFNKASQKSKENEAFCMVSNHGLGGPYRDLTPCDNPESCGGLPVLASFENYDSLRCLRNGNTCIVIGYDTEWIYPVNSVRRILSWQFAVIKDSDLLEFVFLRKTKKYNLSLEMALGCILDNLGIESTDVRKIRTYTSLGDIVPSTGEREVQVFDNYKDAEIASKCDFADGKKVKVVRDYSLIQAIPVNLVCHAGMGDISAFDQHSKSCIDIIRYCSAIDGGLVTLQPVKVVVNSLNPRYNDGGSNPHAYSVNLEISDTKCHAPNGMKSLKALGKVVKWEKVTLPEGCISQMDKLLVDDPRAYFEYASNDSVVPLLYAASIYGFNRKIPVTITSATAAVVKNIMMNALHVDNGATFERVYRGLKTEKHGLVERDDKPGYVESTSKVPISDRANTIQYYASQAFHGGYNSSSEIGYFPYTTWDYDLQNAYPTAMCLVYDVDWENPIRSEIQDRELTLDDFTNPKNGELNPISMFIGYVSFEFPESVKYPCIPVIVDGIPIFPRTSKGMQGVYACGPEICLALRLGAKVVCERGYFINALIDAESGKVSYSLRAAIKQLVVDRSVAKTVHGKHSIEELILKEMVSSVYGKNAQNVVQKQTWSAKSGGMEDIGPSAITNPVSACMITSIVRAVLLAAQNQCNGLGYMTCSVTTDGFISDIPENKLKSLDLYGLRSVMEQSRIFLTENKSREIWEIKHSQNDLVNFTTRGNVSLLPDGVCAHNGAKSGYEEDSYEDRKWLMESVLSRDGPVPYKVLLFTEFKDLVMGSEFNDKEVTRSIRMDFDMKRKPDRSSFVQKYVPLEDRMYEMTSFSTKPFDSVSEYEEFRNRKETVTCLRTLKDWELFWFKTDARSTKAKPRNMKWCVLYSCIMYYRAGLCSIPMLDKLTGQARDDWINSHNDSGKLFTGNDWKNAGKKDRQKNILPRNMMNDKLLELQSDGV